MSTRRAFVAVLGLVLGLSGCLGFSSSAPSAPPPSLGIVQDRPVPQVPLVDQAGLPTSLAAFRGKVVILAPFLSLCQAECPITAGAFMSMRRAVRAAGLSSKVSFVEVSLDPERDTPARLSAYEKEFGVSWPLLTGTPAALAQLWSFFGVYSQKVPEGVPPGTDWWTHEPLTYDVDHSDGFILLGPNGNERFITTAPANLGGRLKASLRGLLDDEGARNLTHPQSPSWTPDQALEAVGWLVGRDIPPLGNG